MFDMVLNTPLSYRDSILYYDTGNTRAFLAQRSKPTTKMTSKVTNNSFRAWFFSLMLLTALKHLERKIFSLLQIIPIVIGRGLEKSEMEELPTLISLLAQDCSVNGKLSCWLKSSSLISTSFIMWTNNWRTIVEK